MRKIAIFVISLCILQNYFILVNSETLLDEDEQACIVASEVSENLVIEAKETHTVYGDDEKYKDFMSCCWKRYGYQHADGKLNWENIREVLKKNYPPAVVHQLAQKCEEINGKTDGDTVVLVLDCLDAHAPSLHHHIHGHYGGGHKNN